MKEGWSDLKITDVATIIHGKNQKEVECENGQYPIYGSGGNIMGYSKEFLCEEGTIILGRKGSINNPIFINTKFWNVDTAFGIVAKNGCNKKYLYYFMKSYNWAKLNTGTTIPSLTQKVVGNVEIPVPSLPEQQRIVDFLDTEFAKIDALKANAEKNLQNAKDLFQAALKKELEPKEGWRKKTLQEISTHIVDCPHTTPIKSVSETIYPCIRTSELKNGEIYWETMQYVEESEYNKRVLRLVPQENDIVYGREGTFGDAVLLPKHLHFCLGQRTMLFRPNQNIVIPKFMLYYIISPYIYNQAKAKNTGCGVGHVNVRDIKEFIIYLPKIEIQNTIVSRLNKLFSNCKTLQTNYEKTIALCDDMKQALLRKAFNGEL